MVFAALVAPRRVLGLLAGLLLAPVAGAQVTTVDALVAAVNGGAPGDTVRVAAGTFELPGPLRPKAGMAILGAGMGQTVITGAASWTPGTAGLPDGDTNSGSVNRNAYLIDLGDAVRRVTVADVTLRGPNLHGAVTGNDCDDLTVRGVAIEDVLWSGIRTFRMDRARIHGNTFVDAGGQHANKTGGAIYATWFADSEIYDNTFRRSSGSTRNAYGVKGRRAKRVRIYRNTIRTNFSIELPHENDQDVEIDHNYVTGTISIPKNSGGSVPASGVSFRIHHNYSSSSYALEWARNGAEVDHNLFDFSTAKDGGNLISAWSATSQGPTVFHNNLIKNPGRGVFWSEEVYNNISFYRNHVVANETVTPRTDGLFGFNSNTDFSTVSIRDNIIEVVGLPRKLVRNAASRTARIENNRLVNVADTADYANPQTGAPQGPDGPLAFRAGAFGEFEVDGWTVRPYRAPAPEAGVWYALRNTDSGLVLDADLGGVLAVARLDAGVGAGLDQQWQFLADGDGWRVDNRHSGRGPVDSGPDGRVVWSPDGATGTDKVWAVVDAGGGAVRLLNAARGRGYLAASPAGAVSWRIDAGDGTRWTLERLNAPTALRAAAAVQAGFDLSVYPNPVRAAATVAYTLDAPGEVSVVAYDVLGRRVAELASGSASAGGHRAALPESLPSGTYTVRLVAGGRVVTQRLTVVR